MQLAVDLELNQKLWNHTENQKKGLISRGEQQAYFYKFFKNNINHRKKSNRVHI